LYTYQVARKIFRQLNAFLNLFGLVLSKPDFIHGSPAFSGSLMLSRRMFLAKSVFKKTQGISGDIFEGGVHWGYGLLIELLLTDRKIHAFDSFKGHSQATEADQSSPKWKQFNDSFAVSLNDVIKTLRLGSIFTEKEIAERVSFHSGWIQDTLPSWRQDAEKKGLTLAYVNADMDIYEPIKCILTNTFPLLSIGGIIDIGVIDNPELLGKTKAFHDFMACINKDTIEIFTEEFISTNGKPSIITFLKKLG